MKPALPGLGLILLAACHTPGPVATATPVTLRVTAPDSVAYWLFTAQPTYVTILALTPGLPIERLAPDADHVTQRLPPGRHLVIFPRPSLLASGASGIRVVPCLGSTIHSPGEAGVAYEVQPALATEPGRTVVLVLLPAPLTSTALDHALPAIAAATPAATLKTLGTNLGLIEGPRWVPLTTVTRSAI